VAKRAGRMSSGRATMGSLMGTLTSSPRPTVEFLGGADGPPDVLCHDYAAPSAASKPLLQRPPLSDRRAVPHWSAQGGRRCLRDRLRLAGINGLQASPEHDGAGRCPCAGSYNEGYSEWLGEELLEMVAGVASRPRAFRMTQRCGSGLLRYGRSGNDS